MLKGARTAWASVVAVVVLAIGAAGLSLTSPSPASREHASLTRSDNRISPPRADRGWKVVSYKDVRIDVPSSWPVVDGMHTQFCGGPFPDTPTAFVGPNLNSPPVCPSPPSSSSGSYGTWLFPNRRGPGMGSVIAVHGLVEIDPSSWPASHVESLWYKGVEIEIGIGPDARFVQEIVSSIGFTPGTPNTPASGTCRMQAHPARMPAPGRPSQHLAFDDGEEVLDPVPLEQKPTTSAEHVWDDSGLKEPYERYRLFFALFSAKYPAVSGPSGWVSSFHHIVAWVIYSAPISPIPGCGEWGLDVYSATNGQALENVEW